MEFTSIKLNEIEMCEILEDKEEEREKKELMSIYMLEKSCDTETNIRQRFRCGLSKCADFDLACL